MVVWCDGAQVRMVGGQLVVDQGTLTVQAQEAAPPRVVVSGRDQLLNSHTYAFNHGKAEKWGPEETENFYNVRDPPAPRRACPCRISCSAVCKRPQPA